MNDEVQSFNAEVVQVDKTNDLAIIKIFDMNFDGVDELPYNFKSSFWLQFNGSSRMGH